MMLRHSNWMPPRKRKKTNKAVKPRGARFGKKMRPSTCTTIAINENPTVARASQVIISNGTYENDRMALRAHPRLRSNEVGGWSKHRLGPAERKAGLATPQ